MVSQKLPPKVSSYLAWETRTKIIFQEYTCGHKIHCATFTRLTQVILSSQCLTIQVSDTLHDTDNILMLVVWNKNNIGVAFRIDARVTNLIIQYFVFIYYPFLTLFRLALYVRTNQLVLFAQLFGLINKFDLYGIIKNVIGTFLFFLNLIMGLK